MVEEATEDSFEVFNAFDKSPNVENLNPQQVQDRNCMLKSMQKSVCEFEIADKENPQISN